jgi:hypothetical protein
MFSGGEIKIWCPSKGLPPTKNWYVFVVTDKWLGTEKLASSKVKNIYIIPKACTKWTALSYRMRIAVLNSIFFSNYPF